MEPVKNKTMTYLLICAVAMVWGIILYRLFFNEVEEEPVSFSAPSKTHEPYDQYVAKNDTFKLALNYRDPFLGKTFIAEPVVKVPVQPQNVQVIPKAVPPPINWEIIRYNGYITNPVTKKMVAILSVNGIERMTAEGETLQGVKLIKNKKDSILVSWMGKLKYIRQ